MTTATWQDLFLEQRHAALGRLARSHSRQPVISLADDEIVLCGGAVEAARWSRRGPEEAPERPLAVIWTPGKPEPSEADFREQLAALRSRYPNAELSGFGPTSWPWPQSLLGFDSTVVQVGQLHGDFQPNVSEAALSQLSIPWRAVVTYHPDTTAAALESLAAWLKPRTGLLGVVPLPAGAGDRIPLAGLTTSGTLDAMVVASLRLLLPSPIRVRASWAALGWKTAQVLLAYGADEIAGWTAAETLAYTGRVRAASRVERKELDEGLSEAGCPLSAWPQAAPGGPL